MPNKFKLTLASFVMMSLTACGGGGGGGGEVTTELTSTEYTGSASQGDLAVFTREGNQLSYELTGKHFDGESGTLELNNVIGNFYTATTGGDTLLMAFANNLAIAVLDQKTDAQSNQVHPVVIGLSNTSTNTDDIADKPFTLMGTSTELIGGNSYATRIIFNNDGTYEKQPVIDYAAGNGNNKETGCWEKSNEGAYINALASPSDCSAVDETVTSNPGYVRYSIRPGTNGAASGIVADYADGTGFAIGVEQKPLPNSFTASSSTFEVMQFIDITDVANSGIEPLQVVLDGTDAKSYYYDDNYLLTEAPDFIHSLSFNKLCDGRDYDGFACVTNNGNELNVLIDTNDGYFIARPHDVTDNSITGLFIGVKN